MHHYFEAITNTSGDSLVGYFARVIDPASLNTITLSADDNGTPIVTVSGVENMASTDAYGNLDFYVVPGTYHLDIYAPNATSFIMRVANVAMNSTKGDPGTPGLPGNDGANSAYGTLTDFKAASTANISANYDGDLWFFTAGDYSATPASQLNKVVVKANSKPLNQGAWVRSVSTFVRPEQFGAKGDGLTNDTAALQNSYDSGKSVWLTGTYLTIGNTLATNGVSIDGIGTLLHARGVDGILINNTGAGNSVRNITLRGFNATLTGSISGTSLTVTAISGTLRPGAMISGTGANTRTMVVSQTSGTTGGVGVYALSVASTVASQSIRFTDALTFNLFNDLVRTTGEDFILEDCVLDGSAGGGVVNFSAARSTFRSLTIFGVHDNGWLIANGGADDCIVDDVLVDGTGVQNGGFITGNAASLQTTDLILRPKLTRLVHRNAADTALEIGQNSTQVSGGDWTLGPSVNPPLFFRDVDTVQADKIVIIPGDTANQSTSFSHISLIPYYKASTTNSNVTLTNVTASGRSTRSCIYFGQSGVRISGLYSDTGAVAADGSDRYGAALLFGGDISNVEVTGSTFNGYDTVANSNISFSTPVTLSNIRVEGNSFNNYNRLQFFPSTTWNPLRWISNDFDGSGNTEYQFNGGTFAATATSARVIIADKKLGRFSPNTLPRDGVITSLNATTFLLPGATAAFTILGDLLSLAGKTVTIRVQGTNDTAKFFIDPVTVTKNGGSTSLSATTATDGWAVQIDSGVVRIARFGATIANGVGIMTVSGG